MAGYSSLSVDPAQRQVGEEMKRKVVQITSTAVWQKALGEFGPAWLQLPPIPDDERGEE